MKKEKEEITKKETKKKEKVTYYDDGSTIADMTCLNNSSKRPRLTSNGYHASEKEKLQTFWATFKLMLGPCIIALGILAFLYVFLLIISGNFF